jgi:hypothetical protein
MENRFERRKRHASCGARCRKSRNAEPCVKHVEKDKDDHLVLVKGFQGGKPKAVMGGPSNA